MCKLGSISIYNLWNILLQKCSEQDVFIAIRYIILRTVDCHFIHRWSSKLSRNFKEGRRCFVWRRMWLSETDTATTKVERHEHLPVQKTSGFDPLISRAYIEKMIPSSFAHTYLWCKQMCDASNTVWIRIDFWNNTLKKKPWDWIQYKGSIFIGKGIPIVEIRSFNCLNILKLNSFTSKSWFQCMLFVHCFIVDLAVMRSNYVIPVKVAPEFMWLSKCTNYSCPQNDRGFGAS